MDDLIVFLNSRLDEDEAIANDAVASGSADWRIGVPGAGSSVVDAKGQIIVYDEGRPTGDQAEHIARHDPARVLREVGAKRAVIAEACDMLGIAFDGEAGSVLADATLRLMVAPYSDHPDCRPDWTTQPLVAKSGSDCR